MQIHDRVKVPNQEAAHCLELFFACDQYLINIGVAIETTCELGLNQDGNTETRKFLLEGPKWARKQKTVTHRAEPDQQYSGIRWKFMEEVPDRTSHGVTRPLSLLR